MTSPTASEMGKRSQQKQRTELGEQAYRERQAAKGRKGGRPRKDNHTDSPTETAQEGAE